MRSVSTSAHKSAMAPAARRERAETSSGRKPYWGPRRATDTRSSAVRSAGVMRVSELDKGSIKEASGCVAGAAAVRK